MKKFMYISLLLLTSSCSLSKYNVFANEAPYAEDIAPASTKNARKAESFKAAQKEEIKTFVSTEEYKSSIVPDDIKNVENQNKKFVYKKSKEGSSEERPVVKSVKDGKFPKIKDIPESPSNFPTDNEIVQQKKHLLNKVKTVAEKQENIESTFTGFDDPLLIYTVEEIMSSTLPEEFVEKRALLSSSIGEELSLEDINALNLVVKDRARNPKPVMIGFYGKNKNFRNSTVGTLLLLGMDPSIIYIKNLAKDAPEKAEISLYY